MNGIKSVLSQKKWADLLVYQFILPNSILVITAALLGVIFKSALTTFLQFAYDGELYLISIFLIIGTFIELEKDKKRTTKSASFNDYWFVVVLAGILIYGFNKISVYYCGNCISLMDMGLKEWMFIIANVASLIVSPYYCYSSIISATR